MEPDFLGYVLNLLDPPARGEVEDYLRDHPEAQAQVETLRQTLEPLSWDGQDATPSRLAERTLHRVAAEPAPARSKLPIGLPGRRFLEAAAVLLLTATAVGLGMAWIGRMRLQHPGGAPNSSQLVACKENLRKVYVSLCAYGDAHQGQFPNVNAAVDPPRNVGGVVFSVLHDSKLLPSEVQVACPGAALPAPSPVGVNEMKAMNDGSFQAYAERLQNGYAYSLGYRQNGQVVGPHLEDDKPSSMMPLMADSSPPNPVYGGHSLSHGGSGQNVLYGDGHVSFCQSRFVGFNQDDIYLNRVKKVAVGVDWGDTVLSSGSPPP